MFILHLSIFNSLIIIILTVKVIITIIQLILSLFKASFLLTPNDEKKYLDNYKIIYYF